jgi:hypothetical protein
MTDSSVAVGTDRLPWLADEPRPRPGQRPGNLLAWVLAASLLIAGLAYWLGLRGGNPRPVQPSAEAVARPTTTVPLPQARPLDAPQVQPEVETNPMPSIEPVAAPQVPSLHKASPVPAPVGKRELKAVSAASPDGETTVSADAEAEPTAGDDTTPAAKAAVKSNEHPDRPWPVRVTDGASGRLVRVGAFTSAHQAKRAWWAMMRNNPTLKRLPALVVPAPSLRDGRTYYRLQMGTTSQAHSEVLCQRMRSIGQSCVVIEVYNRGEGAAG